ncbi:transglutaminase domain-containing protein [Bifidobacterium oedipodis]|nr:transglutaminase domain-containing protein [Bifidobacterium sp. DSM 109957]
MAPNLANHTSHAKPKRPWNKGKKLAAIIAAIVAVVLVVTGGTIGFFVWKKANSPITMTKEQAYGDYFDTSKYELLDPVIDVDAEYEWRIPFNSSVDLKQVAKDAGLSDKALETVSEYADEELGDTGCLVACVFADPNLTLPVEMFSSRTPNDQGNGSVEGADAFVAVSGSHELANGDYGWSGFPAYYIVHYVDADGKKLDKPQVRLFTVRDDNAGTLPTTTSITTSVDGRGVFGARWDPVEGAKQYRVDLIIDGRTDDVPYMPITRTTITTVDSTEMNLFDSPGFCGIGDGSGDKKTGEECRDTTKDDAGFERGYQIMNGQLAGINRQNEDDILTCALDSGTYCTDRYGNDSTFDVKTDNFPAWLAVTAIDEKGREGLTQTTSINSILGQVPIKAAGQAELNADLEGMQKYGFDVDPSYDQLFPKAFSFTTMADGHTQTGYRTFDTSKAAAANRDGYYIPYTTPGTMLTGDLLIYASNWGNEQPDASRLLDFFNTRMASYANTAPPTGWTDPLAFAPDTDWKPWASKDIDSKPIGKNDVESYHPFGSTDFSRYLAENILAGHQVIDITEFLASPSAPIIRDVMREVSEQNPYVTAGSEDVRINMVSRDGKKLLYVWYPDGWANDVQRMHQRVTEAAASVTGNDEKTKAQQIENWIAANGQYDYDAYNGHLQLKAQSGSSPYETYERYPYAWTSGILLKGKGVCASYADAFTAIAREVGLETLSVTGDVAAGRHAWNRVKIDNQWLDTDPTWDDPADTSATVARTDYQLQPVNQLRGHTADDYWMLSEKIDQYGGR